MNKKDLNRLVQLHKSGSVPEKLIVEMILHKELGNLVLPLEEIISKAALAIDAFYKSEVVK